MSTSLDGLRTMKRVLHTYGKRGTKARQERKERSASLATKASGSSEDEVGTADEAENAVPQAGPSRSCSPARSQADAMLAVREPPGTRVEVVIYQSVRPSLRTPAKAKARSDSPTNSGPSVVVGFTGKAKGKERAKSDDLDSGADSTGSDVSFDAIHVTSVRAKRRLSAGQLGSDNSTSRQASPSSKPRKRVNRDHSSRTKQLGGETTKTSEKQGGLKRSAVRLSPTRLLHPSPSADSIGSLFQDLLEEDDDDEHEHEIQNSRPPLLARMRSRALLEGPPRPSLSRSPSLAQSPVKLSKTASLSANSSPSRSIRIETPALNDNHRHTLVASNALQDILQDFPGASNLSIPPHTESGPTVAQRNESIYASTSSRSDLLQRETSSKHVPTHALSPFKVGAQISDDFQESLLNPRVPLRQRSLLDLDDITNDESSDIDGDGDVSGIDLHSINQLRSAGESKRFADGMQFLLEGFSEDSGLTVHRASALEILRKLQDPEFVRKLNAYGFVNEVYTAMRGVKAGEGDRILDTCLLLLVSTLSQNCKVFDHLKLVDDELDVLQVLRVVRQQSWLRRQIIIPEKGATKAEKRALSTLANLASSLCKASPGRIELSAQDLFSTILERYVNQGADTINQLSYGGHIEWILEFIEEEISATGSMEAVQDMQSSLHTLNSLLDQAGEGDAKDSLMQSILTRLPSVFRILVPATAQVSMQTHSPEVRFPSEAAQDPTGHLPLLLKSMLSLTNLSQTHLDAVVQESRPLFVALMSCIELGKSSQIISTSAVRNNGVDPPSSDQISSSQSIRNQPIHFQSEVLFLSLALLENVLESCPSSRPIFRSLHVDKPSAKGHSAVLALSSLMARESFAKDPGESQVLSGFCTLIIIYGLLGDQHAQREAFRQMQDRREHLETLLNAVNELLKLHAGADRIGLDTSQTSRDELECIASELRAALTG